LTNSPELPLHDPAELDEIRREFSVRILKNLKRASSFLDTLEQQIDDPDFNPGEANRDVWRKHATDLRGHLDQTLALLADLVKQVQKEEVGE